MKNVSRVDKQQLEINLVRNIAAEFFYQFTTCLRIQRWLSRGDDRNSGYFVNKINFVSLYGFGFVALADDMTSECMMPETS